MASVCVKQSNVVGSFYVQMRVGCRGDRAAACVSQTAGSGTIVVSSALHLFRPQSSKAEVCSKRMKESSRLNSGPLLRSSGDATERSSSLRSSTRRMRIVACEAHTSRRAEVDDYGYDLYELLGIEKSATIQEIKSAYRWLQKRCHPDIAGPAGHDMSILLNDAYSVLADSNRRAAYDAVCEEGAEFEGYTGQPLYSRWYGAPGEEKAVFVEESRCVGCLKCALIAPNTFAIENQHGRARAVGQWADDETTIKDAITACPVDCISWVDRSKLPALEFVMSKQPRLPVGIDNYSYVGVRMVNVFIGAEKFLKKCAQREERRASMATEETAAQREARMAAAEAIHTRAGRWWHHLIEKQAFSKSAFATGSFANLWDPTSTRVAQGALIPISSIRAAGIKVNDISGPKTNSSLKDSDVERLLEAAKQMRSSPGGKSFTKLRDSSDEDYWTPMEPISCPLPPYDGPARKQAEAGGAESAKPNPFYSPKLTLEDNLQEGVRIIMKSMPVMVSVAAAVFVGIAGGSQVARSETDFVSGPLPASITSGTAMQMFLAAAVWYMIGAAVCEATIFLSAYFISMRKEE